MRKILLGNRSSSLLYPWLFYSTLAIFCELFHLFCKSSSILPTTNPFLTLDFVALSFGQLLFFFLTSICYLPFFFIFTFGLFYNLGHAHSLHVATLLHHNLTGFVLPTHSVCTAVWDHAAWPLLGEMSIFLFILPNSCLRVKCSVNSASRRKR